MLFRSLSRIERHGGKLHAFVAVYADEALRAAHAADEAIGAGHRIGPFHGIPIALKDIIDMKGRVTTGGSKVWEKRVSPRTATLAQKLISAGMIVLGKTHSVEFAMGAWGTNTHMGTPWNPWDMKDLRAPGGSSSGTAAAVAANLAPVALGTETMGSIVSPSAICGIVGLKPTVGLVSRSGTIPVSVTHDTIGPMTRTVRDAAILLSMIAGPDPRDPATADAARYAVGDYTQFLDPDGLRGARIGVARNLFGTSVVADRVVNVAR